MGPGDTDGGHPEAALTRTPRLQRDDTADAVWPIALRAVELCNTNSPCPPRRWATTLSECPTLIAVRDPAVFARQLAEGHHFGCPWDGCSGSLGPWGSARTRLVRLFGGGTDSSTPKRARCRTCRRTQVVLPAIAFPRRADSVETVFKAIALAANGAGHRKVAALVGVPETTVRGWLRRARANANTIRANATVVMCGLDPLAPRIDPTGTPLGDMLEAVGRATMAWDALLGERPPVVPWLQVAALLTGVELLMPNPTPFAYWPPP